MTIFPDCDSLSTSDILHVPSMLVCKDGNEIEYCEIIVRVVGKLEWHTAGSKPTRLDIDLKSVDKSIPCVIC